MAQREGLSLEESAVDQLLCARGVVCWPAPLGLICTQHSGGRAMGARLARSHCLETNEWEMSVARRAPHSLALTAQWAGGHLKASQRLLHWHGGTSQPQTLLNWHGSTSQGVLGLQRRT